MNYVKNNYKKLLIFVISFMLLSLILSTLYYCYILSIKTVKLVMFIFSIIMFLFIGIKSGKNSDRKGYINGIKNSLIYLMILFLISLFFGFYLSINKIVYYILLLISSSIGGMIGINKKSN